MRRPAADSQESLFTGMASPHFRTVDAAKRDKIKPVRNTAGATSRSPTPHRRQLHRGLDRLPLQLMSRYLCCSA